ncbi:MAG: phage/plasmid primase, P4 family [Micrococcales bacterium]
MTKPFKELLERLGYTDEDTVKICYQSASQGFKVKPTKLQLADAVVETLTDLKANVWYEINPSTTAARARAEEINRLSAVWVDIDYKATGIQSAENAHELIELISDLLGVQPSAVVHSGHGLQPYWSIDPEEDYSQEVAASLIQRWGSFVRWVAASQGGQLDSVFDLPRIFRAPGGVNFKDASNPVAVTVDFAENWRPLSIEEIDDVLITHGFATVSTSPDDYQAISSSADWEYAAHDCHWVTNLFNSVRPSISAPKSRHGWLLQTLIRVNAAHRNGCLTKSSAELIVEQMSLRFQEFLKQAPAREMNRNEIGSANRWAVARVESFSPEKLKDELKGHEHKDLFSGDPEAALENSPVKNEYSDGELVDIYRTSYSAFGRTDAANAYRLIHFMRNDYKHVTDVGWHKWDGSRYVLDKDKSIIQTAIEAVEFCEMTDLNPEQLKWAQASANKDRLQNAITIAGTDAEVLVRTIELDAEANDLCTPDGIVNLRTGELRPARKGVDYNTRQTIVAPRAMATPLWDTFLKDIIEDADRIMYLQELFGAALFGDSRFHVLPVFVGTGANGKSTILDVVSGILGDYSATMPENFLLDTTGNAHPTDIARLRGVRLAVASETRPDGKFNESRVKMLTGGDTLSARFMGQNFFDFKPTHTLFMAVNHLPEVKSGGEGFWRRLRKIDFRKTIPAEKRKENFAQLLIQEEGAGILQWMIEGAVRVTHQGFNEPVSVKMATQNYRHEEDHIAKFLDERTILASTASVTKTSLFNAYRDWCIDNGEKPITQNALTREVKTRLGVFESDSVGFKMLVGIDLMQIGSSNNAKTITDITGDEELEWWKQ